MAEEVWKSDTSQPLVCRDCDGVRIICGPGWPNPCPRCQGDGYEPGQVVTAFDYAAHERLEPQSSLPFTHDSLSEGT
jgi:hypothetical protein